MTKILILEQISPAGLEVLKNGTTFEVREFYGSDAAALRDPLSEANVLVVRSRTRVTAEILQQAPALKIIGRAGTGVDNINVEAATHKGIIVMNTPAGNSISTAEHTMGLMLSLLRKIAQADRSMKQGQWERQQFMGTELYEKALGVIGYGKIGSEVVKRAQSFQMKVLVCDPFIADSVARDHNIRLVQLEELLAEADIVTLHAPLTAATRRLINAEALSLMKHGSVLVNAARGDLVDENALMDALKSGKLAGAALDVFATEPEPNRELISMPNVVATPHIGASTVEAQDKVGYDIAVQIRDYFVDGIVRNAVNFPSISVAEYRKVAPFLQLGERLGSFLGQTARGRMSEVAVRYYGDLAEMNTHLICASILTGILKPILPDAVTMVNALETAKKRGIHVVESTSSRQLSYNNLISVKLLTDQDEECVEGTVLHQNHLHIVSVSGIDVDAPLAGDMLIIRNIDTPGVIGRVGMILGDHEINIANFALGRSEVSREAVGVVNVDSEIPESVIRQICSWPQILKAHVVRI